jgi:hypothetical protein
MGDWRARLLVHRYHILEDDEEDETNFNFIHGLGFGEEEPSMHRSWGGS